MTAVTALALFRPNKDDEKLLGLVASSVVTLATTAEEAASISNALMLRPLVQWFVMWKVQQELRQAGLWGPGVREINWQAIADFLIAIAPIIFELIKMFM